MNEQVKQIYKYVKTMEDLNYSDLNGDDSKHDIFLTIQADCYKRVKCFIENITEDNK
ncbi:hypothetical protein Ga0466249_002259 [Sporomusaceae bacterium BoRhaA]|uniref:hypothetical protein n=1 Tax=Pelorhabdus rhamnosifermentans TaxID=2772457 RepID=UPI001C06347B|nr:hypothetical protein [Pelorhabdus rhamnosifermentans]MBU2701145.1 hypothetical protein [Pelorhabdus rhamnosifermentans]